MWFGWLRSQKDKYDVGAGGDGGGSGSGVEERLNKELKVHEGKQSGVYVDNFQIDAFPKKGLKFLMKNASLVEIVKPLVIVKSFDASRYADLLLLMNQLQKTYIYILMDRLDVGTGLSVFTDIGDAILENMYSFVYVLPDKLKHTYDVEPMKVMNNSIEKFTVLRRHMTSVLESYAKKEHGMHIVPISLPRGDDGVFSERAQHRLP